MNKNVKIAKELVKLAKSLVAENDNEKVEMNEDTKELLAIKDLQEFNKKLGELNKKWQNKGYSKYYFFDNNPKAKDIFYHMLNL